MQDVRNNQGKLICMVDSRTKTIEIAIKGCVTKIRFSDDGMERDDLGKFIEQYFNSIQEPSLKIEIRNSSRSMMDFPFQDVTMALYNVVSNSIKANASKLIVLMDNEDNSLVIRFIDDGNGIKSNIDLNTLFDFGISYTRGTGVGLAQIKDLVVNDLHGQVCIKRNEYKGTTLEIKVPYEN